MATHLSDSLRANLTIYVLQMHHKQAFAKAAGAYLRFSGKLTLVCVNDAQPTPFLGQEPMQESSLSAQGALAESEIEKRLS